MPCFDASKLTNGSHPSPVYVGDYCLATMSRPLEVKTEDEVDDFGAKIGTATGVETQDGFFLIHKRLFAGYGVEFQAFQNGPVDIEVFDKTGMMRSTVSAPFDGPQGARRFTAAYLPQGIGFIGLYGSPSAIVEGLILRACPLGNDLGPNPAFPHGQAELQKLLKAIASKRRAAP